MKVGYYSVLYNATGTVIVCTGYQLMECFTNYANKDIRKFSNPYNIIVNNKINKRNFVGFTVYTVLQVVTLNMVMLTIYTSVRANLNTGLSTAIWSVSPFFMSFLDFIVFGVKL